MDEPVSYKSVNSAIRNATGPIVECSDPQELCVLDHDIHREYQPNHVRPSVWRMQLDLRILSIMSQKCWFCQNAWWQEFRRPGCTIPEVNIATMDKIPFVLWRHKPSCSSSEFKMKTSDPFLPSAAKVDDGLAEGKDYICYFKHNQRWYRKNLLHTRIIAACFTKFVWNLNNRDLFASF